MFLNSWKFAAVTGVAGLLLLGGCEEDDGSKVETTVSYEITSDTVTEGKLASAEVSLTGEPASETSVTLTLEDTSEVGFTSDGGATVTDSATVTFDAANWDVPQEVTLVGLLDGTVDESDTATVTVTMDGSTEEGTVDVPLEDLTGVSTDIDVPGEGSLWTLCHQSNYSGGGGSLSSVLATCSGQYLMMACRVTGNATLTVAAYGTRGDVTFVTVGTTNSTDTHLANGVNWYHNTNWSWGLAAAEESVNLNTCDLGPSATKLCWSTLSGTMTQGYGCGTYGGYSNSYERMIYHAN